MVEMGLRKQSLILSGAVPTIQSLATNSAEKVLRILFNTAQDGSKRKPTNKLPIGNVSKSPTPKVRRNNYLN